jgi:hypothetical protein
MRSLRKQLRISRNLGERLRVTAVRMAIACACIVKGIICGVKAVAKEQLGSQVIFENRKCFVCNWAGHDFPTLSGDGGFYQERCNRELITNVISLREYVHRFKSGYSFYVQNWLDIDVNKVLYRDSLC